MVPQGRARGGVPGSDGSLRGGPVGPDLERRSIVRGRVVSAIGLRLPLCVWAQVAAFMISEALDPEGISVPQSKALAWLGAVDGLADPALDEVPGIQEARQVIPDPAAARQALSVPVVPAHAPSDRSASAGLVGGGA